MRAARWTLLAAGALTAAALGGCATGPSALVTLREARATLERAQSARTVAASAEIDEAEGALAYAETEYRLSPGHPLSHVRAENALEKARAAVQSTITVRRTQHAAH